MTDPDRLPTSAELVQQARRELASADLVREAQRDLGLERTGLEAAPVEEPEEKRRRERAAATPDLTKLTDLRQRTATVIDDARKEEAERRRRRETPEVQDITAEGPLQRPSPARGFRRLIAIGAIVAAAIALLGSFTSVSIESGPIDEPEVVVTPADALEAGTCLDQPTGFTFEDISIVPCSEPHHFEVIGHVILEGINYPGDDAVYDIAFDRCLPEFEVYVNTSYDTSIWWLNAFTPTADGWDRGERLATCLVFQYSSDDEILQVTRSARNDGR